MTKDQIAKIDEMRILGRGYVVIARETGIPENTVKSYCRRHPLIVKAPEEQSGACAYCGKPVTQDPKRKKKRFCSDACRMKWWNTHQDQVMRRAIYTYTCPACGTVFSAYGNAHRKYCSHACYINHRYGGVQA